MPLTGPHYDNRTSRLTISLESIDRGIQMTIPLTPEQATEWDDKDLTARIDALIAAVKGFLLPGEYFRINASWNGTASSEILNIQETVEAPTNPGEEIAA